MIQTRQLNLWGFTRLTDINSWSHPHFTRENTEDIRSVRRVEVKNPKSNMKKVKLLTHSTTVNSKLTSGDLSTIFTSPSSDGEAISYRSSVLDSAQAINPSLQLQFQKGSQAYASTNQTSNAYGNTDHLQPILPFQASAPTSIHVQRQAFPSNNKKIKVSDINNYINLVRPLHEAMLHQQDNPFAQQTCATVKMSSNGTTNHRPLTRPSLENIPRKACAQSQSLSTNNQTNNGSGANNSFLSHFPSRHDVEQTSATGKSNASGGSGTTSCLRPTRYSQAIDPGLHFQGNVFSATTNQSIHSPDNLPGHEKARYTTDVSGGNEELFSFELANIFDSEKNPCSDDDLSSILSLK